MTLQSDMFFIVIIVRNFNDKHFGNQPVLNNLYIHITGTLNIKNAS